MLLAHRGVGYARGGLDVQQFPEAVSFPQQLVNIGVINACNFPCESVPVGIVPRLALNFLGGRPIPYKIVLVTIPDQPLPAVRAHDQQAAVQTEMKPIGKAPLAHGRKLINLARVRINHCRLRTVCAAAPLDDCEVAGEVRPFLCTFP